MTYEKYMIHNDNKETEKPAMLWPLQKLHPGKGLPLGEWNSNAS
jgi:hypothetical protein